MPSPFPGMDPYIENQLWEDFHLTLIASLREALIPQVRPHYVVRVEERVYIERVPAEETAYIRPDVTLLESAESAGAFTSPAATATAIAPVMMVLPQPERVREVFLTIRPRDSLDVLTVIEVLSPGNKRARSDGRREYLQKREAVLQSDTHLIELDLLRGGERLPTLHTLPPGDYYAFVRRRQRRFQAAVYAWSLRHPLPPIPVPLVETTAEAGLDLQALFTTLYDRAGYDYGLNYRRPLVPPLSEADQTWAQQLLVGQRQGTQAQ